MSVRKQRFSTHKHNSKRALTCIHIHTYIHTHTRTHTHTHTHTHVYDYFKKGCHSKQSTLQSKGTLGTVIMSDNAPANFLLYGREIMVNLPHYIFCKVSANRNKLFVLLELHSSFQFQYRILTMTTFFINSCI